MKYNYDFTASDNCLTSFCTSIKNAFIYAITKISKYFMITVRFLFCRRNTGEADFELARRQNCNNTVISCEYDIDYHPESTIPKKSSCCNSCFRIFFGTPENLDLPRPNVQGQSSTRVQGGVDPNYPVSYICKFEIVADVPNAMFGQGGQVEMISYKALANDLILPIKGQTI